MYPATHLANSSRLHISDLPNKRTPLFADCNGDSLVIMTTDYFLYQYQIIKREDFNGIYTFWTEPM